MKLVNVKLPERKEEAKSIDAPICGDEKRWPYGLRITFEKSQIDSIPTLKNYRVGDKVIITAEATITSTRISERQKGNTDHSVEMQIEKVAVEAKNKKDPKDMTPQEYKEYRESSD